MGGRAPHGLHDEVADPYYVRTEILDVPTERSAPPSPPQVPPRRPVPPPASPASPATPSSPLEELQAIRILLEEAWWWARALLVVGCLGLPATGALAVVVGLVGWLLVRG